MSSGEDTREDSTSRTLTSRDMPASCAAVSLRASACGLRVGRQWGGWFMRLLSSRLCRVMSRRLGRGRGRGRGHDTAAQRKPTIAAAFGLCIVVGYARLTLTLPARTLWTCSSLGWARCAALLALLLLALLFRRCPSSGRPSLRLVLSSAPAAPASLLARPAARGRSGVVVVPCR